MGEKSAVAGVSARWPARLWVVRHGQSAGNVARDRAEAEGVTLIELEHRDADVPLSELGQRQSQALAAWVDRKSGSAGMPRP
ncbi:MAG TPA: histidine phosphatase family protein, partial [Xanthomonadaceae bacterium]|nr:histidine phosphatase family protein [Xanthomonadaceae bacterium]